jgi:FkbM family methyltransferase
VKSPNMRVITEQDHFHDLKNIFEHRELQHIAKVGVLHVGADVGQEVTQYLEYGFKTITLIEANPECCEILFSKFGGDPRIKIFNYAICDRQGIVDFHIHTSRSGSTEPASILPMKRFKEIVKTLKTTKTISVPAITLDGLFQKHQLQFGAYNFINIDIQGAELLALQGALKVLDSIDVIVSEVNVVEMYENGALEDDVVRFLEKQGFDRKHAIYHVLYDNTSTFPAWGESLFVKRSGLRGRERN